MENVTLNKSPTKKILEKTYGNPLSYSSFISSELLKELKKDSKEVPEVPGLWIRPLSSKHSPLEDPKGLQFSSYARLIQRKYSSIRCCPK